MKLQLLILICFVFAINVSGQKKSNNSENNFTVVFYNTENLFDTIHDASKNDNEFLPNSPKKWTSQRYFTKINNIAKVLSSINTNELPEIICLSEVENKTVLNDLINSSFLKKGNYAIVHEEGPDPRGIDVALLYRKDKFKYLSHKAIPVNFTLDKKNDSREMLYVKGIISNADTLNVFVNHWKSRIGGIDKTESKRMFAAMSLRNKVDSLIMLNPKSKIIIVGDFNDEPTNKSLFSILQANNKRYNINQNDLYNLMYDKHNSNGEGTHYYKGTWNMLDNIIVSYNLINSDKGFKTTYDGGKIFKADWLMKKNPKTNEMSLFETYDGNKYSGGFSDHLPVYVILKK